MLVTCGRSGTCGRAGLCGRRNRPRRCRTPALPVLDHRRSGSIGARCAGRRAAWPAGGRRPGSRPRAAARRRRDRSGSSASPTAAALHLRQQSRDVTLVRLGETPDLGAKPVDLVVQLADVVAQRAVENKGAYRHAPDQQREPDPSVEFLHWILLRQETAAPPSRRRHRRPVRPA